MQITRETDYAIRCVLHLARQPRLLATSAQIAAAAHIPRVFLAKILQRLVRAGLVVSQRGVQGGFLLARDPGAITMLDAVEAVQGPIALNRCAMAGAHCALAGGCPAHPLWVRLSARLARDLSRQTFRQLVHHEQRRGSMGKGGRACPSTPTTRKR